MKRIGLILFATAVAPAAMGQIITSPSEYGWAIATTYADDWRYINGGRSGWHWVEYQDQYHKTSAAMPLNGSTGAQTATGTYYSPNYTATCYGTTSLTIGASSATYTCSLEADTVFNPNLKSNQAASANNDVLNEFSFSIANPSYVSVSVNAPAYAIVGFKNTGTGEEFFWGYGGNSFADTLDPGNYELFIHLKAGAAEDTHLGTSTNLGTVKYSVTGQITVGPGH